MIRLPRFFGLLRRIFLGLIVGAMLLPHHASATTVAEPIRIVMLGDSLTAGYGLQESDSLPSQLGEKLRSDGVNVTIINGGISGDTMAGGAERVEWAISQQPDWVIIALGGNDGLRGIEPNQTRQNLMAIIEALQARKIKTILAGMLAPSNWGRSYATSFNRIYPELAQKYNIPLYPFLLDGVAMEPLYNQQDGIHPNADGVRVIVDKFAPFIQQHIQ